MVRRERKGSAEGDIWYGAYWMIRWRVVKEREISMLDRCRIIVKCALVQCTCMSIQSPCSGILIKACGVQKEHVFIIDVAGGDFDGGLFDG